MKKGFRAIEVPVVVTQMGSADVEGVDGDDGDRDTHTEHATETASERTCTLKWNLMGIYQRKSGSSLRKWG